MDNMLRLFCKNIILTKQYCRVDEQMTDFLSGFVYNPYTADVAINTVHLKIPLYGAF